MIDVIRKLLALTREKNVRVKGEFEAKLIDSNGKIVAKRARKNLVVDIGLDNIANLVAGLADGVAMNYIAVGTSGTTPSSTDTALGAELARKLSTNTKLSSVGQVQFQTTFDTNEANPTSPDTIQEAGLFSASTGGVMLNRVTFAGIAKNSSQKLTVTFTLSFT